MEKLKMLVAIADHGMGEDMARALRNLGLSGGLLLQGEGTAKAQWMETLGLTDTRKDVLFLTAPESRCGSALQTLQDATKSARHFFACTVSLTSVAGSGAYRALTGGEDEYGTRV